MRLLCIGFLVLAVGCVPSPHIDQAVLMPVRTGPPSYAEIPVEPGVVALGVTGGLALTDVALRSGGSDIPASPLANQAPYVASGAGFDVTVAPGMELGFHGSFGHSRMVHFEGVAHPPPHRPAIRTQISLRGWRPKDPGDAGPEWHVGFEILTAPMWRQEVFADENGNVADVDDTLTIKVVPGISGGMGWRVVAGPTGRVVSGFGGGLEPMWQAGFVRDYCLFWCGGWSPDPFVHGWVAYDWTLPTVDVALWMRGKVDLFTLFVTGLGPEPLAMGVEVRWHSRQEGRSP